MFATAKLSGRIGLLAQCAIGIGGLFILTIFPPRAGAMLLLPLGPDGEGRAVATAVNEGARLAGRAPSGQLVVIGERRRLIGPLLREGVLILAAPRTGCNSASTTRLP